MKLCFNIIVPLQQFQVGDGFEADHLIPSGGIDYEISRDREQIGAARRNIFPVFRGIGPRHDLGDHVVQLMGRRKYPSKPPAKRGLLR